MFKIVPNPTFTHDVTVLTPVDGGHDEETLVVTYNYLDTEEVKKFDLNTSNGTTQFLDSLVAKIDGLTGPTGEPIACSFDLRQKLLKMSNVRLAVIRHYFDAVRKVKEGN
ncbi:conserved hypothetical protein [Rhodopseudomonas palustris TIE-1]|uniref:hypothetical protein n=1 Tax=Rhodopseudomonas palustris TaxID=1076 RepID=UPI000164A8A1|nr:hypothetical protein [Rhodopseudomonas palustris]ACF01850.1 conserved hypothetical protein [Rhodopseudomonas palustris TIE-1]